VSAKASRVSTGKSLTRRRPPGLPRGPPPRSPRCAPCKGSFFGLRPARRAPRGLGGAPAAFVPPLVCLGRGGGGGWLVSPKGWFVNVGVTESSRFYRFVFCDSPPLCVPPPGRRLGGRPRHDANGASARLLSAASPPVLCPFPPFCFSPPPPSSKLTPHWSWCLLGVLVLWVFCRPGRLFSALLRLPLLCSVGGLGAARVLGGGGLCCWCVAGAALAGGWGPRMALNGRALKGCDVPRLGVLFVPQPPRGYTPPPTPSDNTFGAPLGRFRRRGPRPPPA